MYMSCVMRKPDFAYVKTKAQICFAVTTKLISAFVFATQIEQCLCFLNPKFLASSHLLCLYSSVFVRPGLKPRRLVFSHCRFMAHNVTGPSAGAWHHFNIYAPNFEKVGRAYCFRLVCLSVCLSVCLCVRVYVC